MLTQSKLFVYMKMLNLNVRLAFIGEHLKQGLLR